MIFHSAGSSRRRELYQIVHTRPQGTKETSHTGGNNRVTIEANYFRLRSNLPTNRNWTIYKYHVTFDPECLAQRVQTFLVGQHRSEIGGYLFDGAQLFTARKLHVDENEPTEFQTETRDKTTYTIRMQFTKIVLMSEQESLQVLNLILRRNMKGLDLTLVGRNFYDPGAMVCDCGLCFFFFSFFFVSKVLSLRIHTYESQSLEIHVKGGMGELMIFNLFEK